MRVQLPQRMAHRRFIGMLFTLSGTGVLVMLYPSLVTLRG
jgi:hypothetical protein